MVESINPEIRLAQLLADDPAVAAPGNDLFVSQSPFMDILGKAVQALEGVSQQETYANQLINGYVNGETDIQKVMTETAKANLMIQLTVTVVNNAVTSFKEITSMQV